MKYWLTDQVNTPINFPFFAGGMAGIFNWMVALPPDVVKSRLQSGIYVLREIDIKCDSCLFIFNLLIVVVLQLTWLFFQIPAI